MITSLTNAKIKDVVLLRDRKKRSQTGLTIIDGAREINRALESGVKFKEIFICRDLLSAEGKSVVGMAERTMSSKITIHETTDAVFNKIAYGERAEGVLAVCEPRLAAFDDLPVEHDPLFIIVESVEKPGNLGAILRTCDGAGVDGVIICDEKTDVYNPNAIRASLGTIFSNKIVVASNQEALRFLQKNSITVCATMPKAGKVYTDVLLTGPLAVIVGSEQKGLSRFWVDRADIKVKIPMKGLADSLNVSATCAVLLYEILRQRSK